MSKLQELMDELCPNGVCFQELGKLILKVDNIKWKNQKGREYLYIDLTSVDRETHTILDTQTINYHTAPSRAQQIVKTGDVLFGTTRPMLKRYCIIDRAYNGNICSTGFCVLRADSSLVLPGWLYHIISSTAFFDHVDRFQQGASYPAISDADVKRYKIPLPPLPVQAEIVRILDAFTEAKEELTDKLNAELITRKKQYEYYRDLLLSFDNADKSDNRTVVLPPIWKNKVKQVVMAEIVSIGTGSKPMLELAVNAAQYPYINAGLEPSGSCEDFNSMGNVITIPSRGYGGAGKVGFQKSQFWCGPLCYTIRSASDEVVTKYLYYFLKSKEDTIVGLRKTGSIPAVNKSDLLRIQVSIPSIAVQRRIVAILDRFDALCNDLTAGLPAEIEARRKQYEHYRDKLLSFQGVGK